MYRICLTIIFIDSDLGMKFTELYEQCKRSFYVNNEQNLRLQLIEFIDHRLIKLGKSTNDGQEIVRLLIAEQDIVKQLLDKLNSYIVKHDVR